MADGVSLIRRYRAAQAARLRALEADPRAADIAHLDRWVQDLRLRCRRLVTPVRTAHGQ